MIIGISGKKQHGKDTVAKIIQLISYCKNKPHLTVLDCLNDKNLDLNLALDRATNWEKKQFASKLKQVVALLIGCKIEQLEDNKFKETLLGEEWRVWYWSHPKLIDAGVPNGRMGPLHITKEAVETEKAKWSPSFEDGKVETHILTPRLLLQLVGTECGRNILHPNIWVNALMADYKWNKNTEYTDVKGGPITTVSKRDYPGLPNWLITDVRFPNEVKAIEDNGGIVIRVNRDLRPSFEWQAMFPDVKIIDPDGWDRSNFDQSWWEYISFEEYQHRVSVSTCYVNREFSGTTGKAISDYFKIDNHTSEISLDNHKFEYTINNNGSLENLISQVEDILKLIPNATS